jgi:hypothetical protein
MNPRRTGPVSQVPPPVIISSSGTRGAGGSAAGGPALAALSRHYFRARITALGLPYVPVPFKLEVGLSQNEELPELPGPGPWLAAGP